MKIELTDVDQNDMYYFLLDLFLATVHEEQIEDFNQVLNDYCLPYYGAKDEDQFFLYKINP